MNNKFKTPLANKKDYLKEAELLIHGEREAEYGDNLLNHRRIATMWNVILGKKLVARIEPEEVAACMIGLKVARLSEDTKKKDSWVDVVGYGALGGEMVSRIEAENQNQKKFNDLLLTEEEQEALLKAVCDTNEDIDDSQA